MISSVLGLGPVLLTGWLLTGYIDGAVLAHQVAAHGDGTTRSEFTELSNRVDANTDAIETVGEKQDRTLESSLRNEILDNQQFICMGISVELYRSAQARVLGEFEELTGRAFPEAMLVCT